MLQPTSRRPSRREIPPAFVRQCRREGRPLPQHWSAWSRGELVAAGWTSRRITRAVASGALIRARDGVYLAPPAPVDVVDACRVGGALTCVSELARWGVFVLDGAQLHVAVPRTSSRLRPVDRDIRVHWVAAGAAGWANADIVDALVRAVLCQPVRAAIATLDSALHLGLVTAAELDEVFAALPRRLRTIRAHLDAAAESGAESIMRIILRRLGAHVQSQVRIPGVGRVDFLVDGWLIVECDSEAHHASWAQQKRDRRRDQAAAARGLATYRPIAEDIFWNADAVVGAVAGLLAMHRTR
jgi:very-short-patch-repair endonuclease